MTTAKDPFGEMSDEEYDALSPQQKGARTRAFNDQEAADDAPAGETVEAEDDSEATGADAVEDEGVDDPADDGAEPEWTPEADASAARVTWLTADATGKARR